MEAVDAQTCSLSVHRYQVHEPEYAVSCRNVLLATAIPLLTSVLFVLPIQIASHWLSVDAFTHFAYALNVGIVWVQCYTLVQQWCFSWKKQREPEAQHDRWSRCDLTLFLLYQMGSIVLAIVACHFAATDMSDTCAQLEEFENIRQCETSDCGYLHLATLASFYWFVAHPITNCSLHLFKLFAKCIPEAMDPEGNEKARILVV